MTSEGQMANANPPNPAGTRLQAGGAVPLGGFLTGLGASVP